MTDSDNILRASDGGPELLNAWMDQHPDKVSRALTIELRSAADHLALNGDVQSAGKRHMVAAQIYGRLRQPADAMVETLSYLGALYWIADSVPAYIDIRDRAHGAAEVAKAQGLDALALSVGLLGADCAFMASEASVEPSAKNSYLLMALRDFVRATSGLKSKPPIADAGESAERLASLSSGVYMRSNSTDWQNDQAEVERLTTALADATEHLVPIEFQSIEGALKSAYVAKMLAKLSSEYGNPNIGSKRRVFALQISQ